MEDGGWRVEMEGGGGGWRVEGEGWKIEGGRWRVGGWGGDGVGWFGGWVYMCAWWQQSVSKAITWLSLECCAGRQPTGHDTVSAFCRHCQGQRDIIWSGGAVSYTHLTLPTRR